MVRAVTSLFVLAATYIGTAVAFTGDGKTHIDEVCPFLIVFPLATWFHPGLGACGRQNTDADRIVALSPSQYANGDRKSTRLNSSHSGESRMPSSA